MEFHWGLFIATLLFGFSLGIFIGAIIMTSNDFSYKDASIMTCEYANKLANATNQCTKTLELYSGSHYETMGMLDCWKLKEGNSKNGFI